MNEIIAIGGGKDLSFEVEAVKRGLMIQGYDVICLFDSEDKEIVKEKFDVSVEEINRLRINASTIVIFVIQNGTFTTEDILNMEYAKSLNKKIGFSDVGTGKSVIGVECIVEPAAPSIEEIFGDLGRRTIKAFHQLEVSEGNSNYRKNTANPNTKSKRNRSFLKKIGAK